MRESLKDITMSDDQIVPYEGDSKAKGLADLLLFIAIWDEDYGPQILDFYPKSSIGDLEALTINIFAAFQFFYDTADQEFKRTVMNLPVSKINRKAFVLLDVLHNPEVRGGLQPFIVTLLVPDYLSDDQMQIFEGMINRISRKYLYEKQIILEQVYSECKKIFKEDLGFKEPEISITELYSYTAAIDDFKAGVQLFQTKNYKEAYPLIKKAQLKFERESHSNLMMEGDYLLGSLFLQQKQYATAQSYFMELQLLAEQGQHQKYQEISTFMLGFCAYKEEYYSDAIKEFKKLEIAKKQFVNELQYFAMYGRTLAQMQELEEAIKKLKRALLLSEKLPQSKASRLQHGQVTYDLGIVHYKNAMIQSKKSVKEHMETIHSLLKNAVEYLYEANIIWSDLNEYNRLITTHRIIGLIFEVLHEDILALENYTSALQYAERSQELAIYLKLSIRIIQKVRTLKLHEKAIDIISTLLEKFQNSPLLDSLTKALLLKAEGESLIQLGRNTDGIEMLLQAHHIFKNFEPPISEEIPVLERIITYYTNHGESQQVAHYTEVMNDVRLRLESLGLKKPNKLYPLGEVKEIWLFSKSIGILYYCYSPESDVDDDLLGGFITALNSLSQEIADKTIETMVFGENRFSIYQEPNRDVYILGRSHIKNPEEVVLKTLSIIYNRFWKEYTEEIINFNGNVTPFGSFTKIIESFDWTLVT